MREQKWSVRVRLSKVIDGQGMADGKQTRDPRLPGRAIDRRVK